MSKFFYAVIAGVSLFGFAAFAEGPKVEDSQGVYVTNFVTAEMDYEKLVKERQGNDKSRYGKPMEDKW